MASTPKSPATLARRLRELRTTTWSDVVPTQRQLADALGRRKPASAPLISSWENVANPVTPPTDRIRDYATFFATRRSVESHPYRLLTAAELTNDERRDRDDLESELLALRQTAVGPAGREPSAGVGGPWHFPDGKPVTIVSAQLQVKAIEDDSPIGPITSLHSLRDLDSIVELYGHIRAANPGSDVVIRKDNEVGGRDLSAHLVVVGSSFRNRVWDVIQTRFPPEIHFEGGPDQTSRYIETTEGKRFKPEVDHNGQLATVPGCFYRGPNPFNEVRTFTACFGISRLGTLGVVRALTDDRFRHRNADHLYRRLADSEYAGLLMRVHLFEDGALTPDWTKGPTRLHEWPNAHS